MTALQSEALKEKMELFAGVEYLIIDEISMVSHNMLSRISARLNQIKSGGLSPPGMTFGGISVIVIGDLYQLAPVLDKYVFADSGVAGAPLWQQFTLNELTANVRQSSDPTWSALLERIRVGDTSQSSRDLGVLLRRRTQAAYQWQVTDAAGQAQRDRLIDDRLGLWTDALRIFHKNVKVHAYNALRTRELRTRTVVYSLSAEHVVVTGPHRGLNSHSVPASWLPESDDDCGGLALVVHLGVGSRVMLRRNMSVPEGLVNGACGRVVGFEWAGGGPCPSRPDELPAAVLVLFDDPRVGRAPEAVRRDLLLGRAAPPHLPVRIEPRFSRFDGKGAANRCQIQRRQIPLLLCWAATVHKVQGLTLDRAVIDLHGAFSDAAIYVALSRVRSLSGLALSSWTESRKVFKASRWVTQEYDRLRVLETRLPALHAPQLPSVLRQQRRAARSRSDKSKRPPRDYAVEAILDKRVEQGAACYRVKWQGYPHEDNTWEPREHLHGAQQLIRRFEKQAFRAARPPGPPRARAVVAPPAAAEWDVECVLGRRVSERGGAEYLVKWQGFPHEDSTWEPERHLQGAEQLVRAFNKQQRRQRRQQQAQHAKNAVAPQCSATRKKKRSTRSL